MVEDQRGLSAAIRAEDRYMFAGADTEVDIVQHNAVSARHVYFAHLQKARILAFVCWCHWPAPTC